MRDLHHHLVTGVVPQRVVDVLEVVDINNENGAPTAVAPHSGDLARELALEAPPVEEPGERVMVGEVRELHLEQLALLDVLDLVDAVQGRA